MSPARFAGESLRSGPSSAPRAAATARSTSSVPASATVQIGSPVAGSIVSNVRAVGRLDPLAADQQAVRRPSDELAGGV